MVKRCLFVCLSVLFLCSAYAGETVGEKLPKAKLLGQGKLYSFIWCSYELSLYTQDDKFSYSKPFYLKFDYKKKIKGSDVANYAAQEIRKIGFKNEIKLAAWYEQMVEIFPDINEGTIITAFYSPLGQTIFYKDNSEIGRINDSEFGKWFFDIWLSEKTSEPILRERLLGTYDLNNKYYRKMRTHIRMGL